MASFSAYQELSMFQHELTLIMYLYWLACIESSVAILMYWRLGVCLHLYASAQDLAHISMCLGWSCHGLQASRAVDVSANNGWYLLIQSVRSHRFGTSNLCITCAYLVYVANKSTHNAWEAWYVVCMQQYIWLPWGVATCWRCSTICIYDWVI